MCGVYAKVRVIYVDIFGYIRSSCVLLRHIYDIHIRYSQVHISVCMLDILPHILLICLPLEHITESQILAITPPYIIHFPKNFTQNTIII